MTDASQPRMARGTTLPVAFLAAALFALLAFAPFASAATDPVASGSTTVTLNGGFVNSLKKKGVKVLKVAPAKLKGKKATFPVTGVIKGWTEALQLMPVGSKWQLFLPSDLAYGDRGAGADIGPGATLVFEVELMSIEDKSKDKTPAQEPEKK